MRSGSILTAFLAGLLTFAFFAHEQPPTVGHAIAGIAVGLPTLLLILLMTQPGESHQAAYRLLVLQLIASGAATVALADQRTALPLALKLLPLALFAVPVIATGRWIARPTPALSGRLQASITRLGGLPKRSRYAAAFIAVVAILIILTVTLVSTASCSGEPTSFGLLGCLGNGVLAGMNAYLLVVLGLIVGVVVYARVVLLAMPADVRAIFKEGRARVIARPDDVPAIAAELRRRVPPKYAQRLARALYIRHGLTKGMSLTDAARYAEIAADRQLAEPTDKPIAS